MHYWYCRHRHRRGCDQRTSCPKQRTLYEVAAINVTDQAGYEASGVVELRDKIKASGAKLIAGGTTRPSPSKAMLLPLIAS